ncbi:MAG: hypothetical protein NTV31_04255, partial [Bacteroidia bacterium]|nr:hypothetical protein [Bacteroidia bacterium]
MKTSFFLSSMFTCLLISNMVYPQTGESKFKMVIVNPNEKKIAPLFPSFKIKGLSFTDANMNRQLDGKEDGSIRFYIKNTGTILLQELNVNLNIPDSTKGISYGKTQTVKHINPGDSTLVNMPFAADEKLKDGLARFEILITDTHSDSIKKGQIIIPTKEALTPPVFAWITPTSAYDKADFSVVKITGVVKTKSNITGLKVYINGQVPDDKKSFDILAT